MPIRMVPDDNQQQQRRIPGGGGGRGGIGGGGNIITALIPLLFGLFGKNPKMGCIIVLIIIAVIYFFGGNLFNNSSADNVSGLFGTGAEFNAGKYDETEIFEPLTDNVKNPLPERVTLEKYAPRRMNQGLQGSCVGWGNAYAARTILESQRTGTPPDQVAFSPAYLYNQIGVRNCQGALIEDAMQLLKKEGSVLYSQFPYDENDCSRQPDPSLEQQASQFKLTGFNRLTEGDAKGVGNEKVDLVAIKQNLAQGAPVVIGMMVGGTFMQPMLGKEMWLPTESDYDMYNFGGHCVCVIGYDDYKEGGAFQIMNSWGPEWGQNGLAWIRYNDFYYFVKEAYGVFPMGNAAKPLTTKLAIKIGLINNANQQNIPLQTIGGNVLKTQNAIQKGTKFKIEVTNTLECYTYVFGQETDGSSYVLFPYTPKHSPYCGITGTRLFPKDYSMQADEVGSKDYMAVVVTKQPIDYKELNNNINRQSGNYEQKIAAALGGQLVQGVRFLPGETISFETEATNNGAVLAVVEIDKY